jgi:hypothetical protein
VGQERPLQIIEPRWLAKPFNGRDSCPLALSDGNHAGTDLVAIQQHRAGTTIAGVAADLGSFEAELVTKYVRQPPQSVAAIGARRAVDHQRYSLGGELNGGQFVHADNSASRRRSTTKAASTR